MSLIKKKLMANEGEFALKLAMNKSKIFANSNYAQDYDILNLPGVAKWLANFSGETGWVTYNYDILSKKSVVFHLTMDSPKNGWVTHDYKILSMDGGRPATKMAKNAHITGWITYKPKILKLNGGLVAIELAETSYLTGWTTDREDILELEGWFSGTVRDILNKAKRYNGGRYTKDDLLANDCWLAIKLAKSADQVFADSEFAQDYDILSQRNGRVAIDLAVNAPKTGWTTSNERILAIDRGYIGRYMGLIK